MSDSLALQVPREVEEAGDAQGGPDAAIPEQVERHQGMPCAAFPQHKNGDAANSDDEHGDDMGLFPLSRFPAGNGEWDENQGKDCDEENNADYIELPEERVGKVSVA